MNIETHPEITTFITTWKNKPKDQVVEELASYCLETNRIPDPYHFETDNDGDLFSPTAKCKIKDVIQTNTYIGWVEAQAFNSIENWFKATDQGVVVWISPSYPGIYPTSKAVISEIVCQDGKKSLFNRGVVLDLDQNGCLKFAQRLASFTNIEQVRATPVILDNQINQIEHFESLVDNSAWEQIKNGDDLKLKDQAIRQAAIYYQDLLNQTVPYDMTSNYLGSYSSSCPVLLAGLTAFNLFYGHSELINKEWFCKKCPVCKQEINTVVKPGEKCPKTNCKAVRICG